MHRSAILFPPSFFRCVVVAVLSLAPSGCAIERANGVRECGGHSSAPADRGIRVEKIAGDGGYISSAQICLGGSEAFVSGTVRRLSLGDPAPGSHVEVTVLDAQGRVAERQAAKYWPQEIPHGQRGEFPQSQFTVRLNAAPPQGSTVQIAFCGAAARAEHSQK